MSHYFEIKTDRKHVLVNVTGKHVLQGDPQTSHTNSTRYTISEIDLGSLARQESGMTQIDEFIKGEGVVVAHVFTFT